MSLRSSISARRAAPLAPPALGGRGSAWRLLVAAVLLLAGLSKLAAPQASLLALGAVLGRTGLGWTHAPSIALGSLVAAEVLLAALVLAGPGRNIALGCAAGFLLAGIGFQVAVRRAVGSGSCGCFGGIAALEASLPAGIARNAALVGACLLGMDAGRTRR